MLRSVTQKSPSGAAERAGDWHRGKRPGRKRLSVGSLHPLPSALEEKQHGQWRPKPLALVQIRSQGSCALESLLWGWLRPVLLLQYRLLSLPSPAAFTLPQMLIPSACPKKCLQPAGPSLTSQTRGGPWAQVSLMSFTSICVIWLMSVSSSDCKSYKHSFHHTGNMA